MCHRVTAPVFVLCVAGIVSGVARPARGQDTALPPSSAAVRARQQIDSVNTLYIKAFGDANVDEVIATYDTAGSELLGRHHVEHGHNAIRRYWAEFFKTYGAARVTLDVVSFWLVGDTAYETGKYTSLTKDQKTGTDQTAKGNYATVWRRQADGGWRIIAVFDTPK